MLVIKNSPLAVQTGFLLLICLMLVSGCGAPGPRALLKGEALIKERQYQAAIEPLQKATSLLPKNAQAWNHLGVAYHGAGQLDQAQRAYKQALALDFNLAPARYNLGSLALEQDDSAAAIEHLTSFTVFQPDSPDGWIKLGNAQVRARRFDQAEQSYKSALALRARDPEALNGLGHVAYHRRKPQEALSFFSAALGENPKYAPAVLNTAVIHQSQNNRPQALQEFRQYASLAPSSPSIDAVNAIVDQLETELSPPGPAITGIAPTPRTNPPTLPPPPTRLAPTTAPPQIVAPARTAVPPPIIVAARTNTQGRSANRPPPATNKATNVQLTQLEDDLVVKPVQDLAPGARQPNVVSTTSTTTNPEDKRSLIDRFNPFSGRSKATPSTTTTTAPVVLAAVKTNPAPVAPPPTYPRYTYVGPARPKQGNRREAERHFAQGVGAQRSGVLAQALAKYQQATETDPAYFEAHYNLGLAAYDLGKWRQSLSAYEVALTLKPESVDTRYNFALALKQAGYPVDAAEELKNILKAKPSETRAHLSLGNLYAQQLAQPPLARQHYLKVLEAEPNHPKGSEIRYWLAANP